MTALHISARFGSEEGVRLLVENGATVDIGAKDQYTALHLAVHEGHDDVVQILLNAGANQDLLTKVRSNYQHTQSAR